MTVLTTTNKTFKLGDGVTSAIPFAFRIFAASDLVVVQTNIATGISTDPLVLNVDYTVTGVGNYNGGQVTENIPAPLGVKTTVARVLPLTQQADIRNQGAFSAEIHEDVFDRLNMVDQQQQEQIDRGISFPIEVFADDFNTELPSELVGRPGATLMVNASGDGFEVGPDASEIISGGASAAASAAAALAALNSTLETYGLTIVARDAAAASAAAAATFNPALYARKDIAQAIAEIFTFAKSPLVPTATTSGQAVNKGQLDAFVIPKHLSGLVISTAGASTTISVSAGYAANSDDTVMMRLAAAINKTTAAWAVGTGNGGLDTGAIANNTVYALFEIMRPDTSVVDILFSLSPTAPTLPANYTKFRRIGFWPTNGSGQWVSMKQEGDKFTKLSPTAYDVDVTNPGTLAVLRTLPVPLGIKLSAIINIGVIRGSTNTTTVRLTDPDVTASTALPEMLANDGDPTTTSSAQFYITTNTSGQVRTQLSSTVSSTVLRMTVMGWIDTRGRDA